MTQSFFERPVLNSPYEAPKLHHALDDEGQPLDIAPLEGRRESKFITPVPKPRKQKKKEAKQDSLVFGDETGLSTKEQEYNPTPIINEIRSHVASWRGLANPADWAVTTTTATLLRHWRSHNFESVRPFFCQVEAVETVIWLTEVARRERRYAKFWEHIRGANEAANPELGRILFSSTAHRSSRARRSTPISARWRDRRSSSSAARWSSAPAIQMLARRSPTRSFSAKS